MAGGPRRGLVESMVPAGRGEWEDENEAVQHGGRSTATGGPTSDTDRLIAAKSPNRADSPFASTSADRAAATR